MAGIKIDASVTNQTGVPMVFALPFASFPVAGVPFRIGFRTDAPYGVYMDNGSAFILIAETDAGGVLSLAAIGSAANANGGTITGTVLNLQPADASFGGVVTTGVQSFAGAKTFIGIVAAPTASPGTNTTQLATTAFVTAADTALGALYLLLTGGTLTGGLTGTTANFTGILTLGSTINKGAFVFTLPGSSGTLALTSALAAYLPLAGGTLTGTLNGVAANFTGALDVTNTIRTDGTSNSILLRNGFTAVIRNPNPSTRDFQIEGDAVTATFKGAGNVLIGTTTDSGFKLDVNGTVRFSNALSGTSASFGSNVTSGSNGNVFLTGNAGTSSIGMRFTNTGGNSFIGLSNSGGTGYLSGTAYAFNIQTEGAQDLQFGTNNANRLIIASTGAATFSSTLGINGTADNIKSGTYTPTAVNISNTSARSAYLAQYMRIGNVVTVSGQALITTVATGATEISLTLPISSTFASSIQASGTANNDGTAGIITSISSTTTVSLKFTSPGALSLYLFVYQYSYQVI
jgi:hypothetical protein